MNDSDRPYSAQCFARAYPTDSSDALLSHTLWYRQRHLTTVTVTPDPTDRTPAEQLFGKPTGLHTHPATHPLWMTFPDGSCQVCDEQSGR